MKLGRHVRGLGAWKKLDCFVEIRDAKGGKLGDLLVQVLHWTDEKSLSG